MRLPRLSPACIVWMWTTISCKGLSCLCCDDLPAILAISFLPPALLLLCQPLYFSGAIRMSFWNHFRPQMMQVATFLLCLAFLYDIFWVFLSARLFGESVMVKVATGGEITQDPTYCEKYPTSSGCQVREAFLNRNVPGICLRCRTPAATKRASKQILINRCRRYQHEPCKARL